MCIRKGALKNIVVDCDNMQFPLDGMLSPTFQNEGTNYALIDGRTILPGESYVINQPGIVLSGSVQITFENDPVKTNVLHVGYITLLEE